MTITYQLTQRDFCESFAAHRNKSRVSKWMMRVVPTVAILLILTNIAFYFTGHLRGSLSSALTPSLLLLLFWILYLRISVLWFAKAQFTKQPAVQGPRTLTLDDVGVHWRWDGGSSNIDWRNLIRYVESEGEILLYSSPFCFNIIPKRALGPEQLRDLRVLLEQKIAKE